MMVTEFAQESEQGQYHFSQGNIGILNGKLVFMKMSAKSAGGMYDPYALKNPYKLKWDKQIELFNEKAHPGVNNCK